MKRTTWVLGLLLVGGMGLLASAPAQATCGLGDVPFGQDTPGACGATYCYVQSPGVNTTSSIKARFWILGQGDPALGIGVDNGNLGDNNWLVSFGGPLALTGNWNVPGSDGCPGTSTDRMAVSFSDVSADGLTSYFAAACATRNPSAANQFDFDNPSGAGHIVLKTLAEKARYSTVRSGTEAQITVQSPSFANIYYTDGSAGCAIANVIPQYDVWINVGPRPLAAPTSRDNAGAWALAGTGNVGSPFTFTTACGTTNCDFFLAVSPKFANGFNTGDAPSGTAGVRVGGPNSTRGQAGPTLANPSDFRRIERPERPTR